MKAKAPIEIQETAAYTLSNADGPFDERIRSEYHSLGSPNIRFSRMDKLSKLGYVAAEKLLAGRNLSEKYGALRVGIILANRSSSLDTDIRHQTIVESRPEEGASPAVFVYTLPNTVIGEISIHHKIKGEGLFFVEPEYGAGSFSMRYAREAITSGRLDAVICGWCDYLGGDYNVEIGRAHV